MNCFLLFNMNKTDLNKSWRLMSLTTHQQIKEVKGTLAKYKDVQVF